MTIMITTLEKIEIESEDYVQLHTATELRYKSEMIYSMISKLHSDICNTQSKEISELSLNATQAFNKLYATLQENQTKIYADTLIEVHESLE